MGKYKIKYLPTFFGAFTILLMLLLISSYQVKACTGFAVYGKRVLYGFNFDYPESEIRFTITDNNGFKFFQAGYHENDNLNYFCGMNAGGVFASLQMLYPQVTTWPQPGVGEIDLFQAYSLVLPNAINLKTTLEYIETFGIKIIHINGTTLHSLYADKLGNAYILEVGDGDNLITEIENEFLIMTNFPVHEFYGKPLNEIEGVGADRYKIAYEYIQENKSDFDFDNGIEILKRTVQKNSNFPTQVSFLFDPITAEVYIILKNDFSKIWKLSINEETVVSYSGFSEPITFSIPEIGITIADLLNATSISENEILIPSRIKLFQNFPNPFNPSTTISYYLPEAGIISLSVTDLLGREIAVLENEYKPSGEHVLKFDAASLPSGVYIYRLKVGDYLTAKKFVILK